MELNNKGRVLFYYSIFNMGGAERSINKLISKLLDEGFQVDLLLLAGGGDFENEVDSRARIITLRKKSYGNAFRQAITLLNRLKYFFLQGISIIAFYIKLIYFSLSNKYQVVIIGLHGLSPRLILKFIRTNKIIQFIRNDLSLCDSTNKAHINIIKYGHKIDYYVSVSLTSKLSFDNKYPYLQHKSKCIYNLLDSIKIIKQSTEKIDRVFCDENVFNILSVSRIQEKSKGVLRMVQALKILIEKGYIVNWYLIGEGKDKDTLLKAIKDNHLENYFHLLGKKSNPYPYMLKAALIAVPSYYEGLCGVVNEAKILKRPLLATQFSGINEQIENGKNGLIVNNDLESIVEGIERLYQDRELLNNLAINEMPEELNNDSLKLKKLISLF